MAWIRRHPVAAFFTMVYMVTVATSQSTARTRRDLLPFGQALHEGGSLGDGLTISAFLLVPQLARRIIVAWFYNNTMRSLWIVGLFHSAYNVTTQIEIRGAFLPVAKDVQLVLYLAIPIVPALLIAVLTKRRLSYQEPARMRSGRS